MKALIKGAVVAVGCAGAMRFAWYRRAAIWLLRTTRSCEA